MTATKSRVVERRGSMAIGAGCLVSVLRRSRGHHAIHLLRTGAHRYCHAVGLVTLGILFGAASSLTHAQAPIRIGASMGLTGAYAQFGQTIQRGYQLCSSRQRKGWGAGAEAELTVLDDQSQVPPAVAIYERLLTETRSTRILAYSSTTNGCRLPR